MTVYNILRANLHQRIKIDNHNNRGVCFHKSCFNILPSESWKQSKLIVLSSADVTFFVFFLYLIENLILFSPWKINLFYSIYITYRKNSPIFFNNKHSRNATWSLTVSTTSNKRCNLWCTLLYKTHVVLCAKPCTGAFNKILQHKFKIILETAIIILVKNSLYDVALTRPTIIIHFLCSEMVISWNALNHSRLSPPFIVNI
jgi:hypothetical protein